MNKVNSALTLVRHIAHKMHHHYDSPAQRHQIAWWLLEAVTHKSKLQLLTRNVEITDAQREKLHTLLHQHTHDHKPLHYLLGSVPFGNLDITVEPPVLIPRPETEQWCMRLIEQLQPLKNEKLTILDMCTGSGCIALSLAHALPNAHVYALDIADEALQLAHTNAQKNSIKNVTFFKSDLFHAIPKQVKFDLIVSNPPYIAKHVWQHLDDSVKQWEDPRALIAQNNGLAIIEHIIANAHHYIRFHEKLIHLNIPQLLIEIGYDQGDAVKQLMHKAHLQSVAIEKDFAHNDRIACAQVIVARKTQHAGAEKHL